jgi:hypothetical protein
MSEDGGRALLMPTDLQSRTQYLALAEFCQPVIGSLSDYVEGTAPLREEALQSAQIALQLVKEGDPYSFGRRTAAALGSYEQVKTLEEAWRDPEEFADVIKLTSDLLNNSDLLKDERTAKAKRLISLFLKLQAKALWNFEQPQQTAAPDVGELCKALSVT